MTYQIDAILPTDFIDLSRSVCLLILYQWLTRLFLYTNQLLLLILDLAMSPLEIR